MVFDYETAWAELLTLLEEDRPNWGARQLRDEMGRILARNRTIEHGFPQALRLYGVEVEARLLQARTNPEGADPTPPESESPGATALSAPPHRVTEEVIDVRAAAAAR